MSRPSLSCKSEKEASKCFSNQDLCDLDTPFSIYYIPQLLGKDIEDAHADLHIPWKMQGKRPTMPKSAEEWHCRLPRKSRINSLRRVLLNWWRWGADWTQAYPPLRSKDAGFTTGLNTCRNAAVCCRNGTTIWTDWGQACQQDKYIQDNLVCFWTSWKY